MLTEDVKDIENCNETDTPAVPCYMNALESLETLFHYLQNTNR